MKILLLSDTHGYIDNRILFYAKKADEVWHAGDIGDMSVTDSISSVSSLKAVYGNIDNNIIRMSFPKTLNFKCEGVKIYMTHIKSFYKSKKYDLQKKIDDFNPDIFISGHSHILKVSHDKKNNLLYMNPGAAGNKGFHKIRTMLKFEITKSKIENLQVIELGKR